ncbi:MAG: DUF4145 domain-containing protein [Desulfobacteraceae bacterium]|nr:DUF4145 domain-containing protein [Desulfobacteraceae bacterium]
MIELLKSEIQTPSKKMYINLKCSTCDNPTRHEILATNESHWQSDDGQLSSWESHHLIQCQGCMNTTFLKETQFSEDLDVNPLTGEQFIRTERFQYPELSEGREALSELDLLPSIVKKIYKETSAALNKKMNVMVGFGVRAIIEAICKDKNISGSNLKEKIDDLENSGYITKEGATILHNLRFMGNEAVHEIKEHQIEELNAAIDVTDYLLKGMYILPKIAEKLPKN